MEKRSDYLTLKQRLFIKFLDWIQGWANIFDGLITVFTLGSKHTSLTFDVSVYKVYWEMYFYEVKQYKEKLKCH